MVSCNNLYRLITVCSVHRIIKHSGVFTREAFNIHDNLMFMRLITFSLISCCTVLPVVIFGSAFSLAGLYCVVQWICYKYNQLLKLNDPRS